MAWSQEQLQKCLRQVRDTYQWQNGSLFGGKLRLPLLEWSDSTSQLGSYSPGTRTLRLSVALLDGPWGGLVEVLKHEMAHQFVFEVLAVRAEGPHGPTFQRVCRERGIDSATRGLPKFDQSELPPDAQRRMSRIEALFALAGSDNQNEAELAMSTARKLMLKYNIEQRAQATGYSFAHLGEPTGRRLAWQRVLANLLSEHFFVEIIIVPVYRPGDGRRASVLEACGTPQNLTIASYVHDFLENTGGALWKAHKKQQGLSSDRDRQGFLYGVMCGFKQRLERETQVCKSEGLVWVADPSLSEFFRSRHPHIRHVGHGVRFREEAFSAGREAGARIVLHRGVEAGRSKQGRSRPRLLTSGGKG